jgi:hypothetical protein
MINNSLNTRSLNAGLGRAWHGFVGQRGKTFGLMIFGALMAFEIFNFSTTEFALHDVLGNLAFAGIKWATMLAIAFCAIDFAGVARLFTPEDGVGEPAESWYLFAAWLLAATMNAALTWWGVSVAINSHVSQGAAVVGGNVVNNVVPIFVAVMVWIIRVLIIGTFSLAGDRLFSMADLRPRRSNNAQANSRPVTPAYRPSTNTVITPRPLSGNNGGNVRPAITTAANLHSAAPARPAPRTEPSTYQPRSEPTYHNLASNVPDDTYADR